MIIKELTPIYSTVKSFYGKARELEDSNNYYLLSYNTLVAVISKATNKVSFTWSNWSATTSRHINEFLQQHNLDTVNKSEILKQAKTSYITDYIDIKSLSDYQLLKLIETLI